MGLIIYFAAISTFVTNKAIVDILTYTAIGSIFIVAKALFDEHEDEIIKSIKRRIKWIK